MNTAVWLLQPTFTQIHTCIQYFQTITLEEIFLEFSWHFPWNPPWTAIISHIKIWEHSKYLARQNFSKLSGLLGVNVSFSPSCVSVSVLIFFPCLTFKYSSTVISHHIFDVAVYINAAFWLQKYIHIQNNFTFGSLYWLELNN